MFDGLRGIAISSVILFHSFELARTLGVGVLGRAAEAAGASAPPMFFLISGFLLYRPYVTARTRGRSGPPVARYARRRALRILPGYWTALTLLAIFPGIAGVFTGDWWRYYGYLQLYSHRTLSLGIPVAWTLCGEVTFYIAIPFWAFAAYRARLGVPSDGEAGISRAVSAELIPIAIVAAGGVIVQLAAAHKLVSDLVADSIAGQCVWMCTGMGLAVASVAASRDRDRFWLLALLRWLGARPLLCVAGAIGALAGLTALVPSGGLYGLIGIVKSGQPLSTAAARIVLTFLLIVLLGVPAVFGEEQRGGYRRLLRAGPVVWLGVVSYSLYLYHLPIMEVIALRHAPPAPTPAFSATGLGLLDRVHFAHTLILLVVGFAAAAAVAAISYRLVELPFLRRKEGTAQETASALSAAPR